MISLLFIVLLILFLLGCALVSASETALFSLSSMKIKIYKEDKDTRKKLISHLLSNPNELLVTLMMFFILMNILVQNVCANLFGDSSNWWLNVGVPFGLTLILGEVVPKSIGLASNEKISYYSAVWVSKLMRFLLPVRKILNIISTYVGRVLFFFLRKEESISVEELEHALKTSTAHGVLNKEEADLAAGYLHLQRTSVKTLMRPREEILFYDLDMTLDELVALFVDQECSRIPVCEGSLDNVIGIITSRQFFLHRLELRQPEDLKGILQKPFFVPETMLAASLLKNFYEKKQTLAVVVDEYGSLTGLITLEDLVEVVIGEIADRRDEKKRYTRAGPDVIIASGKLELHELENIFGVPLESSHQMLTVGGWLTEQMGDIPKTGTKYVTGDFLFHVLSSDLTRVRRVYIRYIKNQPTLKKGS